ncbi:hypothetical protein [Clostridium tagluense]|uniref:hypothetical protein n=1 Tax=Clostridium tagluense TaxID=360422 RepID=UPI001C0CD544|nr:hypothetical protein [Clostridium tagluense]MBU3129389.1 hypothetical protein [Clostridium tagluense]MCB2296497.1 hypothetical protein [Clostridium tagluense]WAG51990.1 hypothetical protein LL095_07015 [Clostridium tagluense]
MLSSITEGFGTPVPMTAGTKLDASKIQTITNLMSNLMELLIFMYCYLDQILYNIIIIWCYTHY